ncbi:MAG: hypothetical protein ACE5K4_04940 [Candidatus Hydrothermarchaeota archaeon]
MHSSLVFAQELNEAVFVNDYALSRLGALISDIFIIGTPAEIYNREAFYLLKIADPTGFFNVLIPKELKIFVENEYPVFFAIFGKVNFIERKSRIPFVIARKVNLVEKRDRDAWLVETTRRTLERIKTIEITGEFSGNISELNKVLNSHKLPRIMLEGIENLIEIGIKAETERYVDMLVRVMNSLLSEFVEPIENMDKLRKEILDKITSLQDQNGVEIERLKLEINEREEDIDNCLYRLLSEGIIYEPRVGRVKKIDGV